MHRDADVHGDVAAVQEYQGPRKTSSPATVTVQLAQASVPIAAPPPQRHLQQPPPRPDAAPQPQPQLHPLPAEQAALDWGRLPAEAVAAANMARAAESAAAAPPRPQAQPSFMEQLALADQGVDAPMAAPGHPGAHPPSAAERPRNEGLPQRPDAPGAQLPDLAVQQQQQSQHF